MGSTKVKQLVQEILSLPESERQELAADILPQLLTTRTGLEAIDLALRALADEELLTLVDRARSKNQELPDQTVAAVIAEALRAARLARRS